MGGVGESTRERLKNLVHHGSPATSNATAANLFIQPHVCAEEQLALVPPLMLWWSGMGLLLPNLFKLLVCCSSRGRGDGGGGGHTNIRKMSEKQRGKKANNVSARSRWRSHQSEQQTWTCSPFQTCPEGTGRDGRGGVRLGVDSGWGRCGSTRTEAQPPPPPETTDPRSLRTVGLFRSFN